MKPPSSRLLIVLREMLCALARELERLEDRFASREAFEGLERRLRSLP